MRSGGADTSLVVSMTEPIVASSPEAALSENACTIAALVISHTSHIEVRGAQGAGVTGQAKAMVAVKVRDEDALYFGHFQGALTPDLNTHVFNS